MTTKTGSTAQSERTDKEVGKPTKLSSIHAQYSIPTRCNTHLVCMPSHENIQTGAFPIAFSKANPLFSPTRGDGMMSPFYKLSYYFSKPHYYDPLNMTLQAYQNTFIELALRSQALKFGEFTLKSGRISPYFFNAGAFQTGADLAQLGACYAEALLRSEIEFDMLLGPAYKGIPLVSATACVLAQQHQSNVPYTFNRKEAKTHGEGGTMVGAPLEGKVAIIDDVITAGTAIREVLKLFNGTNAKPALIAIGLNRNEIGLDNDLSAVQELEALTSVSVISIVQLSDIIAYLEQYEGGQKDDAHELYGYGAAKLTLYKNKIKQYRDRYGAKTP